MRAEALAVVGGGRAEGVPSPLDRRRRVRAVLFDVDGTLYDQRRMRMLMLAELALLPLRNPFAARRTWRAVSAYRSTQEALRESGVAAASDQIARASEVAGVPAPELAAIVDEWMIRRPLKYMRRCRAAGLVELLDYLHERGVELGVLSDYPAALKLDALGVADYFSVVLSATDPDVGVFKPNPGGFHVACDRWRLDPDEVLVVGDRADADAAGATAAGMCAVVIGAGTPARDVLVLPSLERLHRVLANDHDR